jgi:tetratricopeptide (TPR) repeat protein
MSADDPEHPSDKDRLLEEIRRRAEEAELRRLEQDEVWEEPPAAPVPAVPPAPPPVPRASAPDHPGTPKAVRDQKLLVLRERITIAIDRAKFEKAQELLNELADLVPESPEVEEFRHRIEAAQATRRAVQEKKRGGTERRPGGESGHSREGRMANRKKILELLDAAQGEYQQEKYDRALKKVEELQEIDPGNEDGQKLQQQIVKAQRIAELIKKEEARSKADNFAVAPPPEKASVSTDRGDADFWGASTAIQAPDLGLELPPDEKGPLAPPKPPLMDRMVGRVSKVRIPVKTLLIIAAVIVCAGAAYVVFDNIRNAVAPPLHSILVLPATITSGDSAAVWTGEALVEDCAADLAGISSFRVIGPATSMALRGSSRDPIANARAMAANYALQFSLARTGDQLALQSTLYDTARGRAVWTNQVQTSVREFAAARLDLVRRITALLEAQLKPEETAYLRRPATNSGSSFDLYMRARGMLRSFDHYLPQQVIEQFQQAVRIDSFYSEGHSGLGWAYVLAYESGKNSPEGYLNQARWSVQRALSLSQRNAETFRVWGMLEFYGRQRGKAVERLEQSVSVSPSDAESQRRLAVCYLSTGQTDLALKAAQRAVADDPGAIDSYTVLAQVQQFLGDYRAAFASYDLGLRLSGDRSEYASAGMTDVLVFAQMHDRAMEILIDRIARMRDSYVDYYKQARVEQSAGRPRAEWFVALQKARSLIDERLRVDPRDGEALSWKALVHTRLGEFKDAAAALKLAQEIAPEDLDVLYNAARMFALQRDKAQAFEHLRRAVGKRYSLARILDMDFYNLRAESEFQRIVAK